MKIGLVLALTALAQTGCVRPRHTHEEREAARLVEGYPWRDRGRLVSDPEPFDVGTWQEINRDLDTMARAAYVFLLDNPDRTSATVEEIVSGTTRTEYMEARSVVRDRWGTPVRIEFRAGSDLTVRSAGPDRKFESEDDWRVSTTNWQ